MMRSLPVILVTVFGAACQQGPTAATADGTATPVGTTACRNIHGSECYADAFRIMRERLGTGSNVPAVLQRLLELDGDAEKLEHLHRWLIAWQDDFFQTNDGKLSVAMLELYFWRFVEASEVECGALGERLHLVGPSCSEATVDVVYDVVVQSFCPGVRSMSCAFAGSGRHPFGGPDLP